MLRTRALTSRRLGSVSGDAEALYYRLMLVADDFGRFHADPALVQSACYPRRERDVCDPLTELADAALVRLYEEAGETYLVFDVWDQRIDKRTSPKFPEPPAGLQESPGDSVPDGDVDGDVDGDEVDLKARGKPAPTSINNDQVYLLEKLRQAKRWQPLTHGVVVKLNKRYGRGIVTMALQRAAEERDSVEFSTGPYPLLEAMCKDVQRIQGES